MSVKDRSLLLLLLEEEEEEEGGNIITDSFNMIWKAINKKDIFRF